MLVSGVEATCCVNGFKSYYQCDSCGACFEDEAMETYIADINAWKQAEGKLTKDHSFTEKIEELRYIVIGSGAHCCDAVRYYYGCEFCDAIGSKEWASDKYGKHNFDTHFTHLNGQHYHICLQDGCNATTTKVTCSGGHRTCLSKAICDVCKHSYGELGNHQANQEWQKNKNEHWYTCKYCNEQQLI